ncbi:hypothetical protein [Alloactinosynnema sp. L-07]|uniref:hypothetical protein n=1 Tax=Alloactinosynnema sp. L-07 TaxID=1653480 RepID=UPI00065F0B11|nr:hypothetical protein [Alloactinosynnema sp. L-07]CRK62052.1 hypothetical protein [Alloactinosynnema sp. L-07]
MIKVYHPWPVPVRALCYSEPAAPAEMQAWVHALRERGLVDADVRFAVRRAATEVPGEPNTVPAGVLGAGVLPVGVLMAGGQTCEVSPSDFLVHGQGGLEVVERMAFMRRYREP